MKARVPKNKKSKKQKIDPNRPLEQIYNEIKLTYNELIKSHGEEYTVFIAKTLYENVENSFCISKLYIKPARTYIMYLLETSLIKVAEEDFVKPENSSDEEKLNILIKMNQEDYGNLILNSNIPDDIKDTIRRSIQKFINEKTKELNISREELDRLSKPTPHSNTSSIEAKTSQEQEKSIDNDKEVENAVVSNSTELSQTPVESNFQDIEEIDDKNNSNEVVTTSEESLPFFEQVKGYTNNFQYLLVSESMHIQKHKYGKFSSFEEYFKFDIFQKKLKSYMFSHRKTELQAIEEILNKKSKEFSEIDPDFIKILSARKQVITERIQDSK